jgi:hypothetical protein
MILLSDYKESGNLSKCIPKSCFSSSYIANPVSFPNEIGLNFIPGLFVVKHACQ